MKSLSLTPVRWFAWRAFLFIALLLLAITMGNSARAEGTGGGTGGNDTPAVSEDIAKFEAAVWELRNAKQVSQEVTESWDGWLHRDKKETVTVNIRPYFTALEKALALAKSPDQIILVLREQASGKMRGGVTNIDRDGLTRHEVKETVDDRTLEYRARRGAIIEGAMARFRTGKPSVEAAMEMIRLRGSTVQKEAREDIDMFFAAGPTGADRKEMSKNPNVPELVRAMLKVESRELPRSRPKSEGYKMVTPKPLAEKDQIPEARRDLEAAIWDLREKQAAALTDDYEHFPGKPNFDKRFEYQVNLPPYLEALKKALEKAKTPQEIVYVLRESLDGQDLRSRTLEFKSPSDFYGTLTVHSDDRETYRAARAKIVEEQMKRVRELNPTTEDVIAMIRFRSEVGVTPEQAREDIKLFLETKPTRSQFDEIAEGHSMAQPVRDALKARQVEDPDLRKNLAKNKAKPESFTMLTPKPETAVAPVAEVPRTQEERRKAAFDKAARSAEQWASTVSSREIHDRWRNGVEKAGRQAVQPGFSENFFSDLREAAENAKGPEQIKRVLGLGPHPGKVAEYDFTFNPFRSVNEIPVGEVNRKALDEYLEQRAKFMDDFRDRLVSSGQMTPDIAATFLLEELHLNPSGKKLGEYTDLFWSTNPTSKDFRDLLKQEHLPKEVGEILWAQAKARGLNLSHITLVGRHIGDLCRWLINLGG